MEPYSTTHNYLMWMKSKTLLSASKFPSSMNSFNCSWEEVPAAAIQEPLGGFMWPPRSYTCSFCRREFRSAQALGGHMNVHRRDRAKLKQSNPPHQAETGTLHHQQNHTTSNSCQEPPSRFHAQENATGRRRPTELPEPLSNSDQEISPSTQPWKPASGYDDFIETKLSVGMDFVKRHKKSGASALPFLQSKLCSSDRCSDSSREDIDLELRLGDPPAVK